MRVASLTASIGSAAEALKGSNKALYDNLHANGGLVDDEIQYDPYSQCTGQAFRITLSLQQPLGRRAYTFVVAGNANTEHEA